MTTQAIENIIVSSLMTYHPVYVGLFGSFVRGDDGANSDIDVLVKFKDSCSLMQFVALEMELSSKIGRKIDLVTDDSLKNNRVRESVFNDLKIIYQA